ncbi:circadian associated repressor of transcription a isoform 2-T2 [Clarias gariepinus]|uniref:circadian associated repressor of transcription a isoform X2 n=1 Tax=Clarias gariepinus TaxID=13013 RepID=UPI00234D17B0|nr:circadian associated repressor of transcription a isoform X2 [Clarias gariepinus]
MSLTSSPSSPPLYPVYRVTGTPVHPNSLLYVTLKDMQSVESTSTQTSPYCPNFGAKDSEVFLSGDERSEVTGDHGRSGLSSSSSSGQEWSSTESEREKKKETAGGTQGDQLFAQKCLELHGFIRPLLELLNGLKKGRFDKGLNSFQQSVAMDRIQRIIGVLQKPHIGEKYLPTLLQVEMMLKLWFPQVSPQATGTSVSQHLSGQGPSSSSTPPHKQKDQLHIPVKKRRLSWSDTDASPTSTPVAYQSDWSSEQKSAPRGLCGAESGLTWVHVTPILSPPKSHPLLSEREGGTKDIRNDHFLVTPPSPASRGSPATQDNSISSTTPCSDPVTYQIQPVTLVTPTERQSQCSLVTEQLSSVLQSQKQTQTCLENF